MMENVTLKMIQMGKFPWNWWKMMEAKMEPKGVGQVSKRVCNAQLSNAHIPGSLHQLIGFQKSVESPLN